MIPNLGFATSLLLLWLSSEACAAPSPPASAGLMIPLRMRPPPSTHDPAQLGLRAKARRDALIAKYSSPNRKRSTGYNLVVDQGGDSAYYGSLAIGSPLSSFNVILDTGSADLWVAARTCSSCKDISLFDPSTSSTFKNLSSPFSIQYGLGGASGYLAQDVVVMAGFSVSDQGFGVVSEVTSGTLEPPLSGLLGLGWESISSSGQMPFWQTLASSGKMDEALFALQLQRYSNVSNAAQLEPGGQLTLGYTNNTLYKGSIDYIDVSGTPSFWNLPLASLTIQGKSVNISNGTLVAVDSGTTGITAPSDAVTAVYAQISDSSPGTGQWTGYYQIPCSTSVTVAFSFGGRTWTMTPADFIIATLSSTECIGAIFHVDVSSSDGPSWIIGDSFLKNVYSVFRYNPPSVGFAELSAVAIAQNGVNGAAPSATIGSVAATVTSSNGAAPSVQVALGPSAVVGLGLVTLITMASWLL